jgi:D-alanyl-D-alanine carboxypeptidase/D-alanyl-D-alanine-endopeptidase (penicillin-binding protein 4)
MARILELFASEEMLMALLPPLNDEDVAARLGDGAPIQQIVGKSGTMEYALGLAGYLTARRDRRLAFAIFIFDRERRTGLEATMDRVAVEPSPQAREWIRRARALERSMLGVWAADY